LRRGSGIPVARARRARRRASPPACESCTRWPLRSGPSPAPWLAHLWGDDLIKAPPPALKEEFLDWSRSEPAGLLATARGIAAKQATADDVQAQRFYSSIAPGANPSWPASRRRLLDELLQARPQALVEAVQILNAHRDEVVKVMTRHGYTDPNRTDGYLDRDL
jgi:hypothetical protein